MKKSMFFWMAAAIALTSCSNDELVESNNGNAIDFRVAMGSGPGSRGAETTTGNIGKFIVTAYDGNSAYFSNLLFSKNGETFTSTPEYYWPGNDELKFYAYSYYTKDALDKNQLGKGDEPVTCDEYGYTFHNFTPAAAIEDQIDFVSATATGNKTANEENGVPLIFGHNLSRIEIKAKSSSEAYTFKVCGIQIASVASSGTFTMQDNSWDITGASKTSYTVTYNNPIVLEKDATDICNSGNDGFAMLVPQQLTAWDNKTDKTNDEGGTYLAVLLQIRTKGTDMQVYPKTDVTTEGFTNYAWACVPIGTLWEAGNHYTYILDFSKGAGQYPPDGPNPGEDILGGPIFFTAKVTDWKDPIEDNIDMKQKGTNAPATGNE